MREDERGGEIGTKRRETGGERKKEGGRRGRSKTRVGRKGNTGKRGGEKKWEKRDEEETRRVEKRRE